MITILLNIIGFLIIFYAIDYNRTEESKIIPWSKDYWYVLFMVIVASLLFI
jgi:formate hydrogenlyase subunit 3/multisubunit Na+/H+ antiporter MnhD subunit